MVNFKHKYDKLELDIFPTIRSVGYSEKHGFKIGQVVTITSPDRSGKAIFIGYQDMAIQDIPLSFLRFDASPLPIKDVQQFVDLINSFTRWGGSNIKTVKRIHWFRWSETKRSVVE